MAALLRVLLQKPWVSEGQQTACTSPSVHLVLLRLSVDESF